MVRLAADERAVWSGRQAWTRFLGSLLLGAALFIVGVFLLRDERLGSWAGIAAFTVGGACWLQGGLAWASVRFTVTSQRAIVERGLLSRHVFEIELANVRDLQLRQSFWERLLRTGTLEISSAGRDTAEVVFNGIPDPDGVKELIRQGMRPIGKE